MNLKYYVVCFFILYFINPYIVYAKSPILCIISQTNSKDDVGGFFKFYIDDKNKMVLNGNGKDFGAKVVSYSYELIKIKKVVKDGYDDWNIQIGFDRIFGTFYYLKFGDFHNKINGKIERIDSQFTGRCNPLSVKQKF
ncbi:MAG: hypothetical protein FVQ80_16640 [Planctomycetes bacterium]|nr:hypothetical protein [Planctomycetota bacterium]